MGVHHVLHSRTLDFADQIMEITAGKGINIVLNSLADEFIPKSLGILADEGRFLEIGKRGIWSDEQVEELNDSLSYWVYDLLQVMEEDPDLIQQMMANMYPDFESGALKPLMLRAWPIQESITAFRFMAQAKHVGKIVLTIPHNQIESDGSYLITGGTGGVGKQVMRWLFEQGATDVILTGRRGATAETEALIDEIGQTGARLTVLKGDVGVQDDVEQILSEIEDKHQPLRGIFHAAGVLDDGALINQSWDRFLTVLQPKLVGSWHLHEKSRKLGLDFFVFFSSISGVIGNPGQANYAVANTYMDGLAGMRKQQGLPALSINWGAWGEVGMAAATPMALMDATGLKFMEPEDGVAALDQALSRSVSQMAIASLNWPTLSHRVSKLPFYEFMVTSVANMPAEQVGATGNPDFVDELATIPARERQAKMLEFVSEQIALVLGLDPSQQLDTQLGLFDLGMDSLTAVEFSNRLQATFEQTLPPTLAFEAPTIEALSEHLLTLVATKLTGESSEAKEPEDAMLAEIEQMSDEEALSSLLGELE